MSKGDKDRTRNKNQYRKNYDDINWKTKKKCRCGATGEHKTERACVIGRHGND